MRSNPASVIGPPPFETQESSSQQGVLTIEEVAGILRCSKGHVSNALNGRIPGTPRLTHFSIGRRKLIRREWLEKWMEANKSA
jgi:excisionase family DNA binding protein